MGLPVKARAFLALPLAPFFQSDVTPFLERLKKDYPKIRWVSSSEIHATLHFFGTVNAKEISKISDLVAPITSRWKPFEIYLKEIGVFPNPGRPRVIWVGIQGDTSSLIDLQQRIEEGLRSNGFPCEEREFKPHLTLGRVKEGLFSIEKIEFKATSVRKMRELTLFQSQLTPQGSHYEIIETYPFASS